MNSIQMIAIENISKNYGKQRVLESTSMQIVPGKTTVLIGPSGCGKSTLLRLILGLIEPDTGRIIFNGAPLTAANVKSVRHAIGYVIQDGGLFPHLTAHDNITLLARFLQRDSSWIDERMSYLAKLVRLEPATLTRYPRDLSGGQRQRVGLMRALMLDPKVLLLDEPLGALDPITRSKLQSELKTIFAQLSKTVIFVTHDMNEAAYLADDIVLLNEGRVVQRGALGDLLYRPVGPYVKEFIRAQSSLIGERI
jgi:osmoprotectant transport system ATP-binding protein